MYEPYLNREKQYLKVNAELDNRFKGIDPLKSDTTDTVKPRLNVFGNSSKVIKQSTKNVVHGPKPKRNEIKCGRTPSTSVDVTLDQLNLINTTRLLKSTDTDTLVDKPKMLTVANSCLNQENFPERKSVVNTVKDSSDVEHNQTQIQPNGRNTAAALSLTTNEITVKKNISTDGLIKFLKSKVAILKQELEQSQQENVKNLRAYEGSIESNKKNISQIDQLTNENAALKTHVNKLQKTINTHETVIKEKDADLVTLNKEIVVLKKQLKEVNRLHNVLDKRFLKCQDDLEHLKKNLNIAEDCERQQRAVNQQQKHFFEDQIKILSKQRTGLISAYKKQLLLLDNLKRQNLCLEQSKLLQLAEKDFIKVLDWNNQ